jgi:hypothetical protein
MLYGFLKTDIITRRFIKKRGEAYIPYDFTTRAGVFDYTQILKEQPQELYELFAYLSNIFLEGTTYRDLGCSNPETLVTGDIKQIKNTFLCELAGKSEYEGKGKFQHKTVQDYLLRHDPFLIATEVPVFDEERSGFIDLIRFNKKIQILDIKPKAHKESCPKVVTQLTNYRKLFCYQTKIPKDFVECGYFDKDNFYKIIF